MAAQHHEESADVQPAEVARLVAENEALRARVVAAEASLAELRVEALARRAEVRELAEAFPTAMSRRAVLRSMVSDAIHHPDKSGVVRRALAKLGRAPRKAMRIVTGRP